MPGLGKQLVDQDHKIKSTDRSISLAPTDGWQELTDQVIVPVQLISTRMY